MMDINNNNWIAMNDAAIAKSIGAFVKHHRLQQNRTQKDVADAAGINRSTLTSLEKGDTVTIATLIQVLRVLDLLYVMDVFHVEDEISPIEYARLQKNKRKRARSKDDNKTNINESEW